MTFKDFAAKRVAGVPVLYLTGAAVIILGIVAWKMKPAPTGDSKTATDSGSTDGGSDAGVYDGLATQGTVTVVQQPTNPADVTPTVETNDTWVDKGARWLIANDKAPGTVAISALTKYVNGQDRTYDENQLVEAVIKQFGPPPEGVAEGGGVGPKPAQKQFTEFPGVHKITGNSDNSFALLSRLYYGVGTNVGGRIDLLQAANTNLGDDGPWPIGTPVKIPAYHAPVYYTVPTNGMTRAQVAAKNGITVAQLNTLNNGPNYNNVQTFPKGRKLRVA